MLSNLVTVRALIESFRTISGKMAIEMTTLYHTIASNGALYIMVWAHIKMVVNILQFCFPFASFIIVETFYLKIINFIIHSSILHYVVHSKSYSAGWAWIRSIVSPVMFHTLLTEDIATAN